MTSLSWQMTIRGLDCTCLLLGTLATGDCIRNIHVWQLDKGSNKWSVGSNTLSGHSESVEDLQWSPTERSVSYHLSSLQVTYSESAVLKELSIHLNIVTLAHGLVGWNVAAEYIIVQLLIDWNMVRSGETELLVSKQYMLMSCFDSGLLLALWTSQFESGTFDVDPRMRAKSQLLQRIVQMLTSLAGTSWKRAT